MTSVSTLSLVLVSVLALLLSSSIQDVSAATSPAGKHRLLDQFAQSKHQQHHGHYDVVASIPRGGGIIPGGYNPFGYKITALGEEFLSYDGSKESDVGVLLGTLKSKRKTFATLKDQWLEVVRNAKSGQSMRVYRMMKELLDFCVKAGLVN